MPERVRVASVSEIPPGSGREVVVGDRLLAIFNVGGVFYSLDGICPHAGGPLAEGNVQGTVVTCPWHGWQFDVTTGRHCLAPQIRQTQYECRVEGDDVFLLIPD